MAEFPLFPRSVRQLSSPADVCPKTQPGAKKLVERRGAVNIDACNLTIEVTAGPYARVNAMHWMHPSLLMRG
jgi:hypothetical protein